MKVSMLLFIIMFFSHYSYAALWCGNPRPSEHIKNNPLGQMYDEIQVDIMGEERIQIDHRSNYKGTIEVYQVRFDLRQKKKTSIAGVKIGRYTEVSDEYEDNRIPRRFAEVKLNENGRILLVLGKEDRASTQEDFKITKKSSYGCDDPSNMP